MGSIRQGKIESVIQTELASFFQKTIRFVWDLWLP